jgi:hypothetical protein
VFFSFNGTTAFGRHAGSAAGGLSARGNGSGVALPFDLAEAARNLRQELYCSSLVANGGWLASSQARRFYYFLRPALPVGIRKHLQRVRLRGWERLQFPRWPVDSSVDRLMESAAALLLEDGASLPFVWFWPEGASSCVMVTHDVEGAAGRDFCDAVMDMDDTYGVKSAFQIVPEGPGDLTHGLATHLRSRGFEVNLHDFNHDGYLFHDRARFLERAKRINAYVREYQCRGFRSGAMYREQTWFDAFEFSYDMSVPTVAHLEPQRGGCCTVMPYFIGDILELPLTTVQDYSLFHILGDYSTRLWRRQIDEITSRNGLVTLLAHPDYLVEARASAVYRDLLAWLADIREERRLWFALPAQVDEWWRNRRRMDLVERAGRWHVEGPGSDRARVAYARREHDRIVYSFER